MNDKTERRAVARNRTMKKGTIVFGNRYCSTNCSVKNESLQGALLHVYQNHVVPQEIEVGIYPSPALRPAKIVWRTPEMVGIKYLDIEEGTAPQVPDAIDSKDVIFEEERAASTITDEEVLKSMTLEKPYNPDENIYEFEETSSIIPELNFQALDEQDFMSKTEVPAHSKKARGFGRRKPD